MKKDKISNILTSIIAIILVLATAEIIMRFAWQMKGRIQRPVYRKSSNPYLRYELIPNSKINDIPINSDGFRGPEYTIPKPVNTFRIAMLGDSETLAIGIGYNNALSMQLENLLNKNSNKPHYEVLNFGVESYGTLQELELLKVKALKYEPDLIMLNYYINDPEPGEYYFNKTFFMRHSALVRYFSYRIRKAFIKRERRRLGIGNYLESNYYYYQPKYFDVIKKAISEMADIAKKRGRKLVLFIFTVSTNEVKNFKENYPYRGVHQLIKKLSSEDIIVIDLTDEFNRLNLTPEEVSINYKGNEGHKTAAANKIAAEYVYRILKESDLIPIPF